MPPRPRSKPPGRSTISDQLRDVITSRPGTAYAVAQAAGVHPAILSRFLRGERSITMDTLDKIALALDLRLVEIGRRGPKPGRRAAAMMETDALAAEPPPLDGNV